jgi:hypothetical protein
MFTSLLHGRRPGRKSHRVTLLRVEPLPDRLVPAMVGYDTATDAVVITGNQGADYITVLDHGDGSVTVSDETGATFDFSDVDRIEVDTGTGDDVVRYKLDGTLVRDMDVVVYLGSGDNRFTGTLNRDISA